MLIPKGAHAPGIGSLPSFTLHPLYDIQIGRSKLGTGDWDFFANFVGTDFFLNI